MTNKLAILILISAAALPAQMGRNYGRSMVISEQGIVATSQVLASQAGAQILSKGGSAVDAAIAANAVLGVMEPMMTGLGGDLFVMYWDSKTGKLTGLNSSGPAPKALTPEFLAAKGIKTMPQNGIHSVTVPGAVAGWWAMQQKYGKLPWKDLFQAAIAFGEKGYGMPEGMSELWVGANTVKGLAANPESAKVFLPDGKGVPTGQLFRNPAMAHAFRLIAEQGPKAYYQGEIAAAILKTSQHLGGTMTAEDLAAFKPEWVTPISVDYRGWKVYELPPNGQGIAALEMLKIMELQPPAAAGANSAAEMHERIEAMKLAYSDVHRWVADPHTYDPPVTAMLSKEYIAKRAALIDQAKANCGVTAGEPVGSNTTYLTVVDKDGNIATWIQSIYSNFGSKVTVEGMGFQLQNRGGGFTLEKGHPNELAGRKRPLHTIIPAFMERGDMKIAFGIMGGWNQAQAHAQFVSNVVDFHMNIQAALDAPRFSKETFPGCDVNLESRIPQSTRVSLTELGHQLVMRGDFSATRMGSGQAVQRNMKTGMNTGASDPRKDGAAVQELRVPR